MAYSRWSTSVWYTYWSISMTGVNEATLAVCRAGGEMHYVPYEDMKDDVAGAAESLRSIYDTDEEIEELVGYMKMFMEDVEDELAARAAKEEAWAEVNSTS